MGGRRGSVGEERWEFWWEYNKDRFLSRVKGTATVSEAGPAATVDPMAEVRAKELIPALRQLARDRNADVRSSAVLSLGKFAGVEATSLVMAGLRDPERVVRESALLALGFRGEAIGSPAIQRFLEDRNEDVRTRAVAAAALGLSGDSSCGAVLSQVLLDRREEADLRAACAAALGLLPGDAHREALDAVIRDRRQSAGLRAVATVSMAKIGVASDASTFITLLGEKDEEVRRSAAIALGALDYRGPAERMRDAARDRMSRWATNSGSDDARAAMDAEIRELEDAVKKERVETTAWKDNARNALLRVLDKESDLQGRQFAAISLGRVGGPRAVAALAEEMGHGRPSLRSFAALGLGIAGDASVAKLLRQEFGEESNDPSHRAACAIALGLLKDRGAVAMFRDIVADPGKDPDLRGYSAMALALTGDRSSASLLREALDGKGNAAIRRPAGLMLGLVGRTGDAIAMAERVLDAPDTTIKAACCIGLGHLQDPAAASVLARLALDPKQPLMGRNYAALGLGYMGDLRGAPPAISRFAWDHNYRLRIDTLDLLTTML